LGYGIPDFEKADKYLKVNSAQRLISENSWLVLPNPFNDYLQIQNFNPASNEGCLISIYNLQGILLWQKSFAFAEQILLNQLDNLPDGLLVLSIRSGGKEDRFKLIKSASK
jgi:hypothetical protein